MKLFIIAVLIAFFADFSFSKHLPTFIRRCQYDSDPDELGKCVQKVANSITSKVGDGIPELYFPTMDPFHVERLIYDTGSEGSALVLQALFTNMNVEGIKHMSIKKMRIDLSKPEMYVETFYPYWRAVGDYKMDGNVIGIPMSGHGKFDLNLTEVYAKDTHIGEKYIKNGKEYIRWIECISDPEIKNGQIFFENVIAGSPQLSKSTNDLLNDNFNAIYPTVKPLISQTMSSLRLHLLNALFRAFSLDELFEK